MDIHIIDDDRPTILRYAKIAKNCGLSSTSFASAEGYLLAMHRKGYQSPQLILSDVDMGEITGYELLHEVRKIYPNQHFTINSSSAPTQREEDRTYLFLSKPISTERLEFLFASLSSCIP